MGFFYRIFLSRTIGASGLGLYELIFPIFTLGLALCASGIQTAISKFVAQSSSSGTLGGILTGGVKSANPRMYLTAGIILSLGLSVLFTLGLYIGAPWIASEFLKEPRTEELLRIMSYSLIPACIHSCFNGYYYGLRCSTIPAVGQIAEQLARVFGTFLIYRVLVERGAALEPIHAVWGLVLSELAGLLVSATAYLGGANDGDAEQRSISAHVNHSTASMHPVLHNRAISENKNVLRTMVPLVSMALPLSMNHILITASHSIEHLLLPQKLVAYGYTADEALSHFGVLEGMAMSVILFPCVVVGSLSVLLLPRISEAKARGNEAQVHATIKGALCCSAALGSLCTFIFLFSSKWIGEYIFDSRLAGFYIQTLSILCPFLYTSTLLASIVNGLGHATQVLICNLSGCMIRVLTIWFLVPLYGMYAYIISMIVAAVVTTAGLMGVIRVRL